MGCMVTIRIQHKNSSWVWLNMVMHVRQSFMCDNTDPAVVCINHAISDVEAKHFKTQSQLYSSHIAKSPEFLYSSACSSPSHTITHVAMEGNQSSNQSFDVEDGSTMYYNDTMDMASMTMEDTSPSKQSRRISIVHTDITTLHHDAVSSKTDEERKIIIRRADIMNRLKRKMTEYKDCKPSKITRVANKSHEDNTISNNFNDTFVSRQLHDDGVMMHDDMDVTGGPCMLMTASNRYPATISKMNDYTILGPQDISIKNQPLTPLSPAQSVPSESTYLFRSNCDAGTVVVPSSIMTPDVTPTISPEDSIEYEIQSLFSELDESLSLFHDIEHNIKPMASKNTVEKKMLRVLPVLDAMGLEMYLNDVSKLCCG